MITVTWTVADGSGGEVVLEGDDKWTFGRSAQAESPTVAVDHPLLSRSALVIRDAGPGPVVFRGQRDNGAVVSLTGADGTTTLLEEGTAGNLEPGSSRVEFSLGDDVLLTVEVGFEARGTVVERQQAIT